MIESIEVPLRKLLSKETKQKNNDRELKTKNKAAKKIFFLKPKKEIFFFIKNRGCMCVPTYVRTYLRVEDSFRVYEVLRVTIPLHRHSQILLETIK